MPEAAKSDQSVSSMADFVAKYGGVDVVHETPGEEPPRAEAPPAKPETVADPLDATAEALLDLEKQEEETPESPSGEAKEGTETQAVDLEAVAKVLGVDAEDLSFSDGVVKFTTKVDGEVSTVSPAELKKGYQLQSHFTRQNEEFLKQREQWELARQQQEGQAAQLATLAQQVLNADEETLKQQYTRSNWDQLRQDDPAEYAAQVAEYNQKLTGLRQRREGVSVELNRRAQEFQQQQLYVLGHQQVQARAVLADKLGWKDEKTLSEQGAKLRSYMQDSAGFSEQEIRSIADHRPFEMCEKARRYDELMTKMDLARKKVSEPQRTPTGSAPPKTSRSARGLKEAKARLAKSGTVEDAAAVIGRLGII